MFVSWACRILSCSVFYFNICIPCSELLNISYWTCISSTLCFLASVDLRFSLSSFNSSFYFFSIAISTPSDLNALRRLSTRSTHVASSIPLLSHISLTALNFSACTSGSSSYLSKPILRMIRSSSIIFSSIPNT